MSARTPVQIQACQPPYPLPSRLPRRPYLAPSPYQVNLQGQAERQEEEAKHRKSRTIRVHRSAPKRRPNADKELELLRDEVRKLEQRKVTVAGALAAMPFAYETAYSAAYREYRSDERQRQLNGTTTVKLKNEGTPHFNSEDRRLDNRVKLRRWMQLLAEQLASMNNEQRTQLLNERIPDVLNSLKVRSQSARAL